MKFAYVAALLALTQVNAVELEASTEAEWSGYGRSYGGHRGYSRGYGGYSRGYGKSYGSYSRGYGKSYGGYSRGYGGRGYSRGYGYGKW